jgi:hypothetical protein
MRQIEWQTEKRNSLWERQNDKQRKETVYEVDRMTNSKKETLEEREIVQSKTEGKIIIHGVNDF